MREAESGNLLVFEAVIVACIMIGGVLLVSSLDASTTDSAHARTRLTATAEDALLVLSELPATDARAHANLLDELVTRSLHGDCAVFHEKLRGYFPPGVEYAVSLENGHGGRRVLCAAGDVSGERVTQSLLVQPSWSHAFVTPVVTQVPGREPADAENASAAARHPLAFHVVPLRHGFVDERAPVVVAFGNGFSQRTTTERGVRESGPVPPERVTDAGHTDGHPVPFETRNGSDAYNASSTNASQPEWRDAPRVGSRTVPGHEGAFTVHPKFTLASPVADVLAATAPADRFNAVTRNVTLQDDVAFTWDYAGLVTHVPDARVTGGALRVFDPSGALVHTEPVGAVTANATFHVPRESLWGTHVALLQFHVTEVDAAGESTGVVLVVNQLAPFTVKPPAQLHATGSAPAVYRVSLTAGLGPVE